DRQREVSADRPRFGLRGIRLAHHLPHDGDGPVALEDHRDDWPRGNVRHERFEEGLAPVFRIIGLAERPGHAEHLHRDDLESATLEAPKDFTDERALDRVRLQEHERALGHLRPLSSPSSRAFRSARSAGMSLPFGVSIVTSPGAASAGAGTSSETIASSVAARPAARRNACVQGVQRGTRPRWSMFDWHLWEQNRKTVPSFRMNI